METTEQISHPSTFEVIVNAIDGVYLPIRTTFTRVTHREKNSVYYILQLRYWDYSNPSGRRVRNIDLRTDRHPNIDDDTYNKLICLVEDMTQMTIAEFTYGIFGYKH